MRLSQWLSRLPGDRGGETRAKMWLWAMMIVGMIASGVAFAYKVAEFLLTLGSEGARGFAEVPVTVYFFVAAGWMLLLVWSFLSGKLRNLEQAKYEMLEREEEYERRGI